MIEGAWKRCALPAALSLGLMPVGGRLEYFIRDLDSL